MGEVDKDKLSDILSAWRMAAKSVKEEGLFFTQGLRWLAGLGGASSGDSTDESQSYARVIYGKWIRRRHWNPCGLLKKTKK